MSSKRAALDRFGKQLMEDVRDAVISRWKAVLQGNAPGSWSLRFSKEIAHISEGDKELLTKLITAVTDETLGQFLSFLDEPKIELNFKLDDTVLENLCAVSDGMSGELWTEDGWIHRFSEFQSFEE